ncbi:hypothetical protein B484DRAFT_412116, partial [Ochromonadaceae sp. CCMP2298]
IDPDTTALAAFCHDINPSDPTRAHLIREPAWFKEQWLKLRSTLVVVFADFHRSGQMTPFGEAEVEWHSEREIARWVYHSGAKNRIFADVSKYAYAIMEFADFKGLGKHQPDGAGRDSSVAGEEEGNSGAANERRKASRGQAKAKNSGDNIGRSIRESAADESQLETLRRAHSGNIRHCDQTDSDFEREMQDARDGHGGGNNENDDEDNGGSQEYQEDGL